VIAAMINISPAVTGTHPAREVNASFLTTCFFIFILLFFLFGAGAAPFIVCGIADLPSASRRESPQTILQEVWKKLS
jgi:hypothetical protein